MPETEPRYWRCEWCLRPVVDFNRPLGQEVVRPYRLTEDDCYICDKCEAKIRREEQEPPDAR